MKVLEQSRETPTPISKAYNTRMPLRAKQKRVYCTGLAPIIVPGGSRPLSLNLLSDLMRVKQDDCLCSWHVLAYSRHPQAHPRISAVPLARNALRSPVFFMREKLCHRNFGLPFRTSYTAMRSCYMTVSNFPRAQ